MALKDCVAKGALLSLVGIGVTPVAQALTVRSWDFNNTLAENRGGVGLQYMAGEGSGIASATLPGYSTSTIGGQTATVARFDADGAFKATYNFDANNMIGANPATRVNRFSMIMDVKFDGATWISLLQKDQTNNEDGSLFLSNDGSGNYSMGKGSGPGDVGYWGSFDATAWHRIGFTFNCDPTYDAATTHWEYKDFGMYVDGVKINVGMTNPWAANDSYWSMNSNQSGNPWTYIFADNDGDTSGGYINSLALVDECLTADQMATLGGPTAAGIYPVPEPTTIAALSLGLIAIAARRRKKS